MAGTKSGSWIRYDAEMKWYEHIREDVLAAAEEAGVSSRQQLRLELGFEEILVNIISYAYDDPGFVWVKTSEEGECFRIDFADHGKPFDPLAKDRRPPDDMPLEKRKPGGYGIFLVKKNFKSIEYRYEELFGKMANHLSLLLDKE
jgi:anti-sigma regulatory factor (Ser/Thr protein kinase)